MRKSVSTGQIKMMIWISTITINTFLKNNKSGMIMRIKSKVKIRIKSKVKMTAGSINMMAYSIKMKVESKIKMRVR